MPVFLPDQAAHPDQQGVCRSGALCSGAARTSASRLTVYSSSQQTAASHAAHACAAMSCAPSKSDWRRAQLGLDAALNVATKSTTLLRRYIPEANLFARASWPVRKAWERLTR
jgi:hypothetical protein